MKAVIDSAIQYIPTVFKANESNESFLKPRCVTNDVKNNVIVIVKDTYYGGVFAVSFNKANEPVGCTKTGVYGICEIGGLIITDTDIGYNSTVYVPLDIEILDG